MLLSMTKTIDGHFVPTTDDSREIADQIAFGKTVLMDYKPKRSAANHNRYFAFINITFDMQEFYTDKEVWRKRLQNLAGFFDTVVTEEGVALYIEQSIAWDNLPDETKFRDLFNRVINAFIDHYGQGLTREQLDRVVMF